MKEKTMKTQKLLFLNQTERLLIQRRHILK